MELSVARSLRRRTKALYPRLRHAVGLSEADRASAPTIVRARPIAATVRARNATRKLNPEIHAAAIGVCRSFARARDTAKRRVLDRNFRLCMSLKMTLGMRALTVKLRGRTEAPDYGAEGAQFLSARGAQPQAHHGPLQRLLDGGAITGGPRLSEFAVSPLAPGPSECAKSQSRQCPDQSVNQN